MGVRIQKHRNGVSSILVEITSIKDKDGNETNHYFSNSRGPGTRLNLVEGEARRLIDSGRAVPVTDEEPKSKPKAKRATSNKMAPSASNK